MVMTLKKFSCRERLKRNSSKMLEFILGGRTMYCFAFSFFFSLLFKYIMDIFSHWS